MKNNSVTTIISMALFLLACGVSQADSKSPSKKQAMVFGVYPPVISMSCSPGQTMTTSVKIDNPSDEVARFSIEPRGLVVEQSGFTYRPIASLPADSLVRHLRLESPEIEIPAKSFKNLSIFLDVPQTLKGTQYAGLTIVNVKGQKKETDAARSDEYKGQLGVGMQAALGVTIKCHMQGGESYSYEIKNIEINAAQGNQPTRATLEIINNGNAEIKMLPTLILLDDANKVVGRLKGTEQLNLLPGSVTKVTLQSLFKDVPAGQYKAVFSSASSEGNIAPVQHNVLVK